MKKVLPVRRPKACPTRGMSGCCWKTTWRSRTEGLGGGVTYQAANPLGASAGFFLATVSDAAGNEVGTVGQGSRALVRVQTNKDRLKVVWGDKPDETCWLDYALDEKQTANASGFTHLKLRCEVTGGKEATAQTAPNMK